MRLVAPTSKSMTQRALVLATLADGPTRIVDPLDCDDARHLSELVRALGGRVTATEGILEVEPPPTERGQFHAPTEAVFLGNAGTAVRFGAGLSLLVEGALTIDGDEHMRKRPLGPLVEALGQLGVEGRYLETPGCPPVTLVRRTAPGRRVRLDGSLSSQYASGLMMVGPRLPNGLSIHLEGAVVSRPYLAMTAAMMARAGVAPRLSERDIEVTSGSYCASELVVEADWSGAAFLLAGGFIAGTEVEVPGLMPPGTSLQGDAAFADMLTQLRQPPPNGTYRFDLTNAPDLIAPLVAACLFVDHPTVIRGAAHTRIKESDRVAVLATQLGRLGFRLTVHDDGLDITPGRDRGEPNPLLDPDHDHRMAMAFGLVSLRVALQVKNPSCVTKSFPTFWQRLAQLSQALHD